ncbi:hypothetical protein BIY26_12160 [Brenneria goodwinii]|uniref:Uncharacterized protein n=1 Tax=Brenneria goodwinii TaxID=1109412 RepID=A0A0G4JZ13_9GAMM|nr:hypothetical protein [Brenneria goodwinii]ATA23455.1 hypothetical protein AWC36_04680 [Brenneria goodwinii]RLM23104.1 hypothetical protein BIY26_12160 [Brenneria goodwinii]CPR19158.1 FIG00904881: hypothetical protein [Brenneria goodwinii]
MSVDSNVRQQYEQARRRVAAAAPVTLLSIDEQQTTVACGTGPQPESILHLRLGFKKTAQAFFKHLPPTPDEMELAIMTVEDDVMAIRHDLPVGSSLFCFDPELAVIARLSGAKEDADGWLLPLESMEQTFKRLERVMLGSPASWEGIPLESAFSARLLILREFMHHHGFDDVRILATAPVT